MKASYVQSSGRPYSSSPCDKYFDQTIDNWRLLWTQPAQHFVLIISCDPYAASISIFNSDCVRNAGKNFVAYAFISGYLNFCGHCFCLGSTAEPVDG